jgi:hypothetical protein
MFTGIGVLGVLAGSLASLFNLEQASEDEHANASAATQPRAPSPSTPNWPRSKPNCRPSNVASAHLPSSPAAPGEPR